MDLNITSVLNLDLDDNSYDVLVQQYQDKVQDEL